MTSNGVTLTIADTSHQECVTPQFKKKLTLPAKELIEKLPDIIKTFEENLSTLDYHCHLSELTKRRKFEKEKMREDLDRFMKG